MRLTVTALQTITLYARILLFEGVAKPNITVGKYLSTSNTQSLHLIVFDKYIPPKHILPCHLDKIQIIKQYIQ